MRFQKRMYFHMILQPHNLKNYQSPIMHIKGVGANGAKQFPWQFFPEILIICSGTLYFKCLIINIIIWFDFKSLRIDGGL